MSTSDAPQPPGGPQREDEPAEETQQGDDERDLQEENAETSLDQPSS